MRKQRIVVAALVVTVCAGEVSAADTASAELEEVMVTSSRTERPLSTIPNTVTVISSAELEQQLAIHNDISTVLGNLIPSFSPSRQKMTNAGESLRGRKPLYMIDGIPQSSPLREGGRDGHIIDSAVLARVEVLHGANACNVAVTASTRSSVRKRRSTASNSERHGTPLTRDTLGVRYAQSDGRYDSNADGRVDADLGGANIAPDRVNVSWDRSWSALITSRLQVNWTVISTTAPASRPWSSTVTPPSM